MKKQNKNDNAANRKSYVGHVFNIGEKKEKEAILNLGKGSAQNDDL